VVGLKLFSKSVSQMFDYYREIGKMYRILLCNNTYVTKNKK